MERIFRQIAVFSKDAWSGLIDMESSFLKTESNARLIQSVAMDEIVVIVLLDIGIGATRGSINFCIPCINLETIIDQLNHNRFNSKRLMEPEKENALRDVMVSHINGSPLEVEGVFGRTAISLREVLNLQVGDVIALDPSTDKQISLSIGGRTWFYGTPGVKRSRKAVKISKVL
jgi:flagellar motor switch protein FliM